MNKFNTEPILSVKNLTETVKKEIVQRITRNLLDIKKQVEAKFSVTLRHGALYPLLNSLEQEGFLTSQRQQQGGRTRKVYTMTHKGEEYVKAYEGILKEQIQKHDI